MNFHWEIVPSLSMQSKNRYFVVIIIFLFISSCLGPSWILRWRHWGPDHPAGRRSTHRLPKGQIQVSQYFLWNSSSTEKKKVGFVCDRKLFFPYLWWISLLKYETETFLFSSSDISSTTFWTWTQTTSSRQKTLTGSMRWESGCCRDV